MNRFRAFFFMLMLMALSSNAWAQGCDKADPTTTDNTIDIDARDGSVSGPQRFRVNEQTHVVLRNKNPFRYSYTVKVEEHVVVEDAISKFFTLAGISAEPPKKEAEKEPKDKGAGDKQNAAAAKPAKLAKPPKPPQPCNLPDPKDLDAQADKLQKAVQKEIDDYANFTEEVKTQLGDVTLTGRKLCETVRDVTLPKIKGFKIDDEALTKKLKALQDSIDKMDQALDNTEPSCTAKEKAAAKTARNNAEKIADWAGNKILEIQKANKDVAALLAKVNDMITHDPSAFWESRALGPHLESTEADITITRHDNMTDKTEEFRPKFTVVFGSTKRFFIAGGIAASAAHRREFTTVNGFVRDRNGDFVKDAKGDPTPGNVVGLTEDSSGRVAPSVLLHGMIVRPNTGIVSGYGLSLGVGAAGSDSSVLQYFLGPTISFAEDHLFVTLGAFRGTEKKLGGDFYVGAEVKDGVTVPIVDRTAWTFGFALTYRIQ